MRLKHAPADFRVEEISEPPPLDTHGAFQVYRVSKQGIAPFDAIQAVARAFSVPPIDVAFAGLKDQRSHATQLASVKVPGTTMPTAPLVLEGGALTLEPIGRAVRAVRSEDIERNRFTIVVRDVSEADAEAALARAEVVRRTGLANYFDDQRFGGASPERGFVAEAWSRGDLKRALELLIARPSPKDPRLERLEKKMIAERFGKWQDLAREVKGDAAPVVRQLARAPDDLGAAFRALDGRFRALLVAQYQSFLWNEAAAAAIRAALPRPQTFDVMYECGTLVFWRDPPAEALAPLRAAEPPHPPFTIPPEIGVSVKEGARPLTLVPFSLDLAKPAPDEAFKGRRKLVLKLELPRGAYGSLVAKRLFYEPNTRRIADV